MSAASLQKTQFRVLYRDFLFRVVELDILTSGAEVQNLLVQFAAILAAFSFVLTLMLMPSSPITGGRILTAGWSDQEFLLGTTIAVVGLFGVLAWNALLPDRRDSLVLGPLPVSIRTMFLAKTAAIATALGGCVLATNLFTGFGYPAMAVESNSLAELLRMYAAYWITSFAAGVFMFSALLALQGVAARVLTYRAFLRFSSFMQMVAFFVILSEYFLRPPLATWKGLTAPENQTLLHWLPSFWFLGLFQVINGSSNRAPAIFGPLAARALWGLAAAVTIAAVTYGLAWARNLRLIVEQPDIQPGDRTRPAGRTGRAIVDRLFPRSIERAIVMFTARTIARSRQHRLILAAYGGVGLAAALVYVKNYIYGYGIALARHAKFAPRSMFEPNQSFLAAGVLLLLFAIVGMRAVFALPIALPSNWIFRITAVHRPAAYFEAVRKALYLMTAIPLWFLAAAVYFALWPGRPALEHLIVMVLGGAILIEILLYQFRKIPFACSYLPGGGNVHMRLAMGAVVFLTLVEMGTYFEYWTMEKFARWLVLAVVLAGILFWRRRLSVEYNSARDMSVQFEDFPDAVVSPLDLRQDGEWSNDDAFVDAIDPHFGRTWPQRLRPLAIGALALIVVGFVYEHIGAWRDSKRFPQIGQSFNIGGRSLNIYCSGSGGPTVVFDAGHAVPGYAWLLVQRDVAQFTKACWYDRAGFGWSDPAPDTSTVDSMADDLHKLLAAAHIAGPYVLVGHSLGGWNVRMFRDKYPQDVAGLILVDVQHEDLLKKIPNLPRRIHPEFLRRPAVFAGKVLGQVGVFRLLAPEANSPMYGFTQEEWNTLNALNWQPKSLANEGNESGGGVAMMDRLREMPLPKNLPFTVMTAGKGMDADDEQIKIALNQELAARSALGKQVVVWNSGHGIPQEAPEEVIEVVREMVMALRIPYSGGS